MSFFIAARKDTLAQLETGGRSPDLTGDMLTAMRAALCTNYGVNDTNLSVLVLADGHADALKIIDGYDYVLVWTAGEVTGVDFSAETSKRIVKVAASKSTILADNTDSTTITIELWKADGSGIATTVTASADVPISTPNGISKVRISIVNGVATRNFKTSIPGVWQIPYAKKRFSNLRVASVAIIESIQAFDTL